MKFRSLLLVVICALPLFLAASPNVSANFTYNVYYSPQQGTYVETWLSVKASTVTFAALPNGNYASSVEVLLLFQQGDEVVNFMKYQLTSPEIEDTTARAFSFLDQQRILLGAGDYTLLISLRDIHSDRPAVESTLSVSVNIPSDAVSLSTLMLLEKAESTVAPSALSRGGYNLYPDFMAFYPESISTLTFYCETYHTGGVLGANSGFLHRAWIESFETSVLVNNISFFKRERASDVVPFLHSFNIRDLPSGNYYLVVEVRDQENNMVATRRTFFQRSNPAARLRLQDISAIDVTNTFSMVYNDPDSLADYIRSCMPLASDAEILFADNLIKLRDVRHMQQFLYHFWSIRTPVDPGQGWRSYKAQVDRVNLTYSTFIKRGYETDRGIIWLRYGEPNSIYKSVHEPEAYPYEIWHYYRLDHTQSNRKFVFVNYGIGAGDYELAHSNATGEMQDPQWHLRLHSRHAGDINVDRTQYDNTYGSRALEIFNNPF